MFMMRPKMRLRRRHASRLAAEMATRAAASAQAAIQPLFDMTHIRVLMIRDSLAKSALQDARYMARCAQYDAVKAFTKANAVVAIASATQDILYYHASACIAVASAVNLSALTSLAKSRAQALAAAVCATAVKECAQTCECVTRCVRTQATVWARRAAWIATRRARIAADSCRYRLHSAEVVVAPLVAARIAMKAAATAHSLAEQANSQGQEVQRKHSINLAFSMKQAGQRTQLLVLLQEVIAREEERRKREAKMMKNLRQSSSISSSSSAHHLVGVQRKSSSMGNSSSMSSSSSSGSSLRYAPESELPPLNASVKGHQGVEAKCMQKQRHRNRIRKLDTTSLRGDKLALLEKVKARHRHERTWDLRYLEDVVKGHGMLIQEALEPHLDFLRGRAAQDRWHDDYSVGAHPCRLVQTAALPLKPGIRRMLQRQQQRQRKQREAQQQEQEQEAERDAKREIEFVGAAQFEEPQISISKSGAAVGGTLLGRFQVLKPKKKVELEPILQLASNKNGWKDTIMGHSK